MADLTASEAVKVRLYLGYDRRDQHLTVYLRGLTDEDYATVQDLLAQIDEIHSKVHTSAPLAGAYERIEEVTFRGSEGQAMLASHGNSLVSQLATFLGVYVRRYPFAGGIGCGPIGRA